VLRRVLVTLASLSLAFATAADASAPAAEIERRFADLRELRDALDVADALGTGRAPDGRDASELRTAYATLRERVAADLASTRAAQVDAAALAAMRQALATALPPAQDAPEPATGEDPAECSDAPPDATLRDLQRRLYSCYAEAQSHVRFGDETIDRLTVFARLAATDDREERRRLFLALEPVWRSVDGDGSAASLYRRMIALSAARWSGGDSYVARNLAALGVDPDAAERWLEQILAAWRDATPAEPLEPWDLHYAGGALNRALADRVPRPQLEAINDEFHATLGADPRTLGIRYDLAPREGKTPVAFTTFGRRPREVDGRWVPGEAWVFATYRVGGFDNLVELLHETGHGIHIQAIRARPAFADWPDSDTFTEALAELVTQEAYEPEWQRRWLGAAAPLATSLRSKYAGIVLDICWALFELRMHRDPAADPNRVWSDLTHDFLRVVPHPEWAWWAMRGQLVDSPGYMMNYALGAVIAADLRARARELRGPLSEAGPTLYPWLAERLFRFGLERSSRQVIEEFLGRPLSPAALLADLARMRAPASAPLALVGGTLVDLADGGRRGRDFADTAVLLDGGRVVAAGRRDEVPIPAGALVVDVGGKFLLPGLIDGFAGMNSPAQARAYLHAGVTAIVGVAGPRRGALDLAAAPRPRVFLLESVGYDDEGEPETDPEAVRRRVDRLAAGGARVLLLMYPLPPESLAAALERARELGLATIGELGRAPYESALALGVQAFVHTSRYSLPLAPAELRARVAATPFGPAKLDYYRWLIAHHAEGDAAARWADRLGRSRTALIPTLAMEYLDLPGHANPWREAEAAILDPAGIHLPADRETGERSASPGQGADAFPPELAATLVALETSYAAAGALHLAGSGTSAFGTMPGISLRHEIELLVRVGLTPRQALAAATTNYGAAFGWRDVGCLDPGCHADLLVLARDPTLDLGALREIDLLVVGGEPLDRAALLEP
jgi:hypothetical protein